MESIGQKRLEFKKKKKKKSNGKHRSKTFKI